MGSWVPRASGFVQRDAEELKQHSGLCIGFDPSSDSLAVVLRSYGTDSNPELRLRVSLGKNTLQCEFPTGLLPQDRYQIAPRTGLHNHEWIVHAEPLGQFQTHFGKGDSPFWAALDGKNRRDTIEPIPNRQSRTKHWLDLRGGQT